MCAYYNCLLLIEVAHKIFAEFMLEGITVLLLLTFNLKTEVASDRGLQLHLIGEICS